MSFEKLDEDIVQVEISGVKSTPGEHWYRLTLTDEYEKATMLEVPYIVKVNHAPVQIAEIGTLAVNGVKGTGTFDVNNWFSDKDNEELFAVVSVEDRSVVATEVSGSKVTFTGRKVGRTKVTLTASDAKGESASQSFVLVVRDSASPLDVYPNPATDHINIRPGADSIDASVTIANQAGTVVYSAGKTLGINSPLRVEVGALAPGRYTVRLRMGSQTYGTSTFVKK